MNDASFLEECPPHFPLAYAYAREMIQQWALAWPRNPKEAMPWFHWLVSERQPLFADLVFAYRNQIFAVTLNVIENGKARLTEADITRLLDASEAYQLIPCVIEVYCQGSHLHLKQALIDVRTGEPIDPLLVASEDTLACSSWELHHCAIQVVATEALAPKHYKIETTCSLPERQPQLWFRDHKGCLCWCLVRETYDEENAPLFEEEIETLLAKHPQLQGYDGFFIGVCMTSQESTKAPIYRGHAFSVSLTELQQIHSAHFEC